MTSLSPQAQAVLDATGRKIWYRNDDIAAALRAAADQVVPEEDPPADFLDHPVAAEIEQRQSTRAEFLAIAAELEKSDV
jgi:hypothetical protein